MSAERADQRSVRDSGTPLISKYLPSLPVPLSIRGPSCCRLYASSARYQAPFARAALNSSRESTAAYRLSLLGAEHHHVGVQLRVRHPAGLLLLRQAA